MAKLCIMYLTDKLRPYMFPRFVSELSQCKYLSEIVLLVLTHDNDLTYYQQYLQESPIQFKLGFVDPDRNYLKKIGLTLDFIKNENIPYLMKHDNDILMSHFMYDYLFENLSVLEDSSNIVLTPTLTSGIPTCDMFIEDFLTPEEQTKIKNVFLKYTHGPLWGTDYTALNKFTVQAQEWDSKAYYRGVKIHPHHYKGIHPVRMSEEAILTLNEMVLNHKEQIFSKGEFSLFYDKESPYFCNSVFCIKGNVYNTLLNRSDLYVDNYDEVPLNKWRDMFNLNIVIVRKGAAIHSFYNTIDHYITYERAFVSAL